jgi:hypothetical protein
MNMIALLPFIALMAMVVTLLSYSVLKLCGVESITSVGATFKIVGSFVWFSGMIAAVLAVTIAFFVKSKITGVLPLMLFFAALMIRSIIFVIKENKLYTEQTEQKEAE